MDKKISEKGSTQRGCGPNEGSKRDFPGGGAKMGEDKGFSGMKRHEKVFYCLGLIAVL